MNVILLLFAIPATLFLAGCGFFGDVEEVGQPQTGRTVYRGHGESTTGDAVATPVPQKVPGESR